MSVGYKELVVWQKSMDMVIVVYKLTEQLPNSETYALSDQMRRAAVSVPSNIAEGQQRRSPKEFLNFLSVARGSLAELETQLLICLRLEYFKNEQSESVIALCHEIGLMLISLMKSLEA
ncbi:MAG: four helix bundle protein [Ruminococcaceae bacterium]|nr:four helix bundle protein [Oscillospiraceae bacterium]